MTNVARTSEETAIKQITPDELIGYLSSMNTGTKKGTYYNESNEQVSAMAENVDKMIDVFRPFAALMALSPSATDDARIITAIRLLSTKLEGEEGRMVQRWECSVITDALGKMPPKRVFNLFHHLNGNRRVKEGKKKAIWKKSQKPIGGRFTKGLALRWLQENYGKLDLWSVKYSSDMKRLARDIKLRDGQLEDGKAVSYSRRQSGFHGAPYLFGKDANTPLQSKIEKVKASTEVPAELWKLPYENARGFALNKFGMSAEEFEERFSKKGQKTVKEARTSAKRTKKAGGDVTYDPSKERDLYSLYVYLGGQETIPSQAMTWINKIAQRQAQEIGLRFKDAAVIVDTSASMFGTAQTKRHPLFKSMALAKVIEKSTDGKFGMFYTTEQENPVIPKLHGATSYAPKIVEALKEGFTTIVLIGDGYENAPEGMTHRVLYAFKKKIDTEDKVSFLHLNPVQAAESVSGIREMSPHVPAAGIKDIKGISSSIFIALAKTYPVKALEAYFSELARLQSPKAKELMPPQYQRLLTG
jgi:hypothetical protein